MEQAEKRRNLSETRPPPSSCSMLQYESQPDDLPNPKDIDALLASEMNGLSVQERERALMDLHCIRSEPTVQETPELIDSLVPTMTQHMNEISADELIEKSKEGYEIIQREHPDYLKDRKILVKFLRAAEFDPMNAAQRLVRYLEWKLKLFGPTKVSKRITIADLEEDDQDRNCLEAGIMQVLPRRDRAGRQVMCHDLTRNQARFSFLSKNRIRYYGAEVVSEVEENQKNGISVIFANWGPDRNTATTLGRQTQERQNLLKEIPETGPRPFYPLLLIRPETHHFCTDDSDRVVGSAIMKFFGKHARARFRRHCGSFQDLKLSLATFGIPSADLPFDEDCKPLLGNHRIWMQQRRQVEGSPLYPPATPDDTTSDLASVEEELKRDAIMEPTEKDVVCGRGGRVQWLPGNQVLRDIVASQLVAYDLQDSKFEKSALTFSVVKKFQDKGGRFLRKVKDDHYEIVTDEVAHQKVSSLFRTLRKAAREEDQLVV